MYIYVVVIESMFHHHHSLKISWNLENILCVCLKSGTELTAYTIHKKLSIVTGISTHYKCTYDIISAK